VKQAFTPPVIPKSEEQTARLKTVMTKTFLFSNLEQKDLELVIGAMQERPAKEGECLINQGDDGDFMYAVESGTVDCSIDGTVVKTCTTGDAFGELALLYNCPRKATVVSRTDSILWQLDRKTFNHIVADAAQKKRSRYETFLEKSSLMASMTQYERSQLADVLRAETFDDGATVVNQGEDGDKFYIIEEGTPVAVKDGAEVKTYGPGDYFGELALIRSQPRAATVACRGPAKLLSVDSKSFRRLFNISELEKRAHEYA
jgi:cAMP-dependent protein kinase regulator